MPPSGCPLARLSTPVASWVVLGGVGSAGYPFRPPLSTPLRSEKFFACGADARSRAGRLAHDLNHGKNRDADRTVERYLRIKQNFDPLTVPHLVVDTSQPIDQVVQGVVRYLWQR